MLRVRRTYHSISMDAIWETKSRVSEDPPILESLSVRRDIELVDRRGIGEIVLVWERVRSCVRDVYRLVVWAELYTIRGDEVIGNGLNDACARFESIHLRSD